MAVIQHRPTHILYLRAKFGDDRNFIFDVCDVLHVKGLYPYFDISGVKGVSQIKYIYYLIMIFTIFESPWLL